MNAILHQNFPDQELGFFLNDLMLHYSCLEKSGLSCAYFGVSPKAGSAVSPVVFRIGRPESMEQDVRFIGYARAWLGALFENPIFLTTYEMDDREIGCHGEIDVGGGLSLPNYYVSAVSFPREWGEVMAFLFGCFLEARICGKGGCSWLSNAAEENFGLFSDSRVVELIVRRGVLARVLPEMRRRF